MVLTISIRRSRAASFVLLEPIVWITNRTWEQHMKVAEKNENVVVGLIAKRTQIAVANALGIDRTNFNRFHNSRGHGLSLKKFCEMLELLGLDLSRLEGAPEIPDDVDTVTMPRAEYEAMLERQDAMRTLLKHSLGD
ncbi:MAG: hypothetical protein BGP02_04625 [Pandoraea sp. 64-18]|nr:MAG: hypothetical protein BGP02_04625 [Pandoraea sp. 64-18]